MNALVSRIIISFILHSSSGSKLLKVRYFENKEKHNP